MEQPPCRGWVRARWVRPEGPQQAADNGGAHAVLQPSFLASRLSWMEPGRPSLCHHILSVGGPLLPTKGCEWVLSSKWAQRTCGGWW